MSTRRKSTRLGRPKGSGHGISESSTLIRLPELLRLAVEQSAETEGVPISEWWRRAARVRLASGDRPATGETK